MAQIKTISNAVVLDDGDSVGFTIETEGGQLDVHCGVPELGDIFSTLGQLAKAAGDVREKANPGIGPRLAYLAPIPAEGLGLQLGNSPDQTLIVMRLSGFDVAFEVPSNGLAQMADELRRMLLTLSAAGRPQ